MPNLKRFLENKEAVSPVIGVVLMVAITVILAAAIGSSVFGNDMAEQAPQANINIKMGAFEATADNSTITLEHLGGDTVTFDTDKLVTKVVVSLDGADSIELVNVENVLNVGDTAKVVLDGINKDGTTDDPITLTKNQVVNVKIIDVETQQVICEKDIQF